MVKKKRISKEEKEIKIVATKKQNKQLIWAVILMLCLIIIVLIVPFIMNNFVNKFNYLGLTFYKTKTGTVVLYSTSIPVIDAKGNTIGDYKMNFRSDPRKLNYINTNSIADNEIRFVREKTIFIATSTEMKGCEDTYLAIANFANFLNGFARLNLKGAVSNKTYAKENNITYASCKDYPDNTVISINSGNSTKIERNSETCYNIIYEGCDIIKATEKFNLMVINSYMKYYQVTKK